MNMNTTLLQQMVDAFVASTQPDTMNAASARLVELEKQPGFNPLILQLILEPSINLSAKHAGAFYVKNMIVRHWYSHVDNPKFLIPEQDKIACRQLIVDCICQSPINFQNILSTAYSRMISWDFPTSWDGDIGKVVQYLNSPDANVIHGTLRCFYEIVLKFSTKTKDECKPLHDIVERVFPTLLEILKKSVLSGTEKDLINACRILRIFFKTTEFVLPPSLMINENLAQWMEVFFQLIRQPVPEEYLAQDEDERLNPVWKSKRNCFRILNKFLSFYGTPKMVADEYKPFAQTFIVSYGIQITNLSIDYILQTGNNVFIPLRLQYNIMDILNAAVYHSQTYALIRARFMDILAVVLNVVRHTDEDEQMWQEDPHEYVRRKYDPLNDYKDDQQSAILFLKCLAKTRKNTLQVILNYCYQILHECEKTANQDEARKRDACFIIIGSLADRINKKEEYTGVLEPLLTRFVLPDFESKLGFLRARACWTVNCFSSKRFSEPILIATATKAVIDRMGDPELPVRVMAGNSISNLVHCAEAQEIIKPLLAPLFEELVKLMNDTANNELTDVINDLLSIFGVELAVHIVKITENLSTTCINMLNFDEDSPDGGAKAVTAFGLIQAMNTIVYIFRENNELVVEIIRALYPCVDYVFRNSVLDFLEDALELITEIIEFTEIVTPEWWKLFPVFYQLFEEEGLDYFDEYAPVLIAYMQFGTDVFMGSPDYPKAVYSMCKKSLESDRGEMADRWACQVLEALMLFGRGYGHINELLPYIVHVLMTRMSQPFKIRVTKLITIQTIGVCLYCQPSITIQALESLQAGSAQTQLFFNEWFTNLQHFKNPHDIRLLSVALCSVLQLSNEQLPQSVVQGIPQIAQAIVDALHSYPESLRIHNLREEERNSEIYNNEYDSGESDEEVVSDNEDAGDKEGDDYLEYLESLASEQRVKEELAAYIDGEDELESIDDSVDRIETPLDNVDPRVFFLQTFQPTALGGRPQQSFDEILNIIPNKNLLAEIYHHAQLAQQHEASQSASGSGYQFRT